MWKRKPAFPVDHFGNKIAVGDRYFYGNPPTAGIVIQVKKSSIVLDIGADSHNVNMTMMVKSPSHGICIDLVPDSIFKKA